MRVDLPDEEDIIDWDNFEVIEAPKKSGKISGDWSKHVIKV